MPIAIARPRNPCGTRKYASRSENRKTLSRESDRSIRYTVVHSPAGPSASAIPAPTASAKSSQPPAHTIASPRPGVRCGAKKRSSRVSATATTAAAARAKAISIARQFACRRRALAMRRASWLGMEPCPESSK
jgi:hypothetical protein